MKKQISMLAAAMTVFTYAPAAAQDMVIPGMGTIPLPAKTVVWDGSGSCIAGQAAAVINDAGRMRALLAAALNLPPAQKNDADRRAAGSAERIGSHFRVYQLQDEEPEGIYTAAVAAFSVSPGPWMDHDGYRPSLFWQEAFATHLSAQSAEYIASQPLTKAETAKAADRIAEMYRQNVSGLQAEDISVSFLSYQPLVKYTNAAGEIWWGQDVTMLVRVGDLIKPIWEYSAFFRGENGTLQAVLVFGDDVSGHHFRDIVYKGFYGMKRGTS